MAKTGSRPGAHRKNTPAAAKAPAKKIQTREPEPPKVGSNIPLDLQQRCLDIFRDALRPDDSDAAILQEVKGHLYNRDFATAFGKEDYLRVYASRWSPSRALAYLDVLASLHEYLELSHRQDSESRLRIACLGGGAGGELVALAAWASGLAGADASNSAFKLDLDLVDMADWHRVTEDLHRHATTPPELSKYASQAKRDANRALVEPESFSSRFHQLDVLAIDSASRESLVSLLGEADLVTFMFTLNELYSTSLPSTQALLSRITETMRPGSHLLVVDSPGSYSTVSLNGAEKKYPMQWLLDYTLLSSQKGRDDEEPKWEKVVSDESRWFRLSKQLRYPILLEDMRFQMHLYRRK